MNDFTKDELKAIHTWAISHLSNIGLVQFMGENRELQKKIISMIDNYCEFKIPTMKNYCCNICNEEWHLCECESKA